MFTRDAPAQVRARSSFKDNLPSFRELAYVGLSDGQYWRSVVFSLLAIALVIGGITSAICWYGFVDNLLYWSGNRIPLDTYLNGDLSLERLPPSWISQTQFIFQSDDGSLSLFNTGNNKVSLLVPYHTLKELDVKGYVCSNDLKYILLKHRPKQIFKNSFIAQYTIFNVSDNHQTILKISSNELELQSASWAGNTNTLVMVQNNDIYIRYWPLDKNDIRITHTGVPDIIFNGIPDWLYQEEIFKDPEKAFWSSADGSHLIYVTFNDSEVQSFEYPWLENNLQNTNSMKFPTTRTIRYPTPGTKNPTIQLWITNIQSLNDNDTIKRTEIHPPEIIARQDYFFVSASWINSSASRVSIIWMNRVQNMSIVSYCEAPSWICIEPHTEMAPENMWLEIQHHPVFPPSGDSFLFLAPIQESGYRYFTQIKHVTLKNKHVATISYGGYEVIQIIKWDTINHVIYYEGTDVENTGQQHLYMINDDITNGSVQPEPKCLTCDEMRLLSSSWKYFENCTHFSAYFSPWNDTAKKDDMKYILQCNGPRLPIAGIYSIKGNKLLKIVYSIRNEYRQKLQQYALPTSLFSNITLGHGHSARVKLLLPPSWRQELRDAAFPVIIQVNGRPNSQSVSTKWNTHWGTYMSSKRGVVYVEMDVRGSKGQSTELIYGKFGDIEMEDQIYVINTLLKNYKYLDQTRIGIWGWEYGGYITAMLMSSQQKKFKCGIAVAPIFDWNYYNSAFTERVLGLKTVNSNKGYGESDVKSRAKYIPSHSFYIIQSLADISVPYQHGIMLARALAEYQVIFHHQIYANEGHTLSGRVLKHAVSSMDDYFKKCLSLEEDDDL